MKKFLIGLLGIVMVASMSACSSDSPASGTMPGAKESPAQESKMVTVEDMKGTVDIPANPVSYTHLDVYKRQGVQRAGLYQLFRR